MNRTRASSLDAFGTRNQRNRILPALEASDGSTLSLNFTQMSSLDSRFTFSRITASNVSTPATFINSSGFVTFADHNLAVNSTWTDSNTTPTSWTIFNGAGTAAVISIPQSGQRQFVVTSGVQSFLYQAQTPSAGMAHTLSVVVHSVTGTGPTAGNLLTINGAAAPPGAASILYYKDGVLTNVATAVTPGVWSMVFSGGDQIRLLQGSNVATSTYTIVLSAPQLQRGVSLLPARVPNSSTSIGYQAPRFDYDPTTLTPRGLLIEGAATNLATRSDDFNTSVSDGSQWVPNSYTSGTLSTTLPDGTTGNARRISLASGSGSFRSQALTVTASTAYTWSFWARNNGGSQARYRVWNVTAGSSIVDYTLSGSNYVSLIGGANNTSSTWVRVSVSFTTPAGCTSVYVYPCSSDSGSVDLLVWGAQVEAGSGASSYTPTGSSTVTRAADKLTMSNISLMGWNQTAGTFLWDMDVQSETNTSSFPAFAGMYRAGPVRVIRFQLNNSSGTNPRIGGGTWTATPSALVADTFYTRSVATPFKAAVAFANTGQSMTYCINGTVQSTATGTGTLATPTLFLMHQDPSAADTEYFPIHLRQLKYWPTNLSSSDLRSITT